MYKCNNQQPDGTPVVRTGGRTPGTLGAPGQNDDAGAEEHGEDAHHLLKKKRGAELPGEKVYSCQSAREACVEIDSAGQGEKFDVDDQDADQGEAPQHINTLDSLAGCDGTEGSSFRSSLFHCPPPSDGRMRNMPPSEEAGPQIKSPTRRWGCWGTELQLGGTGVSDVPETVLKPL